MATEEDSLAEARAYGLCQALGDVAPSTESLATHLHGAARTANMMACVAQAGVPRELFTVPGLAALDVRVSDFKEFIASADSRAMTAPERVRALNNRRQSNLGQPPAGTPSQASKERAAARRTAAENLIRLSHHPGPPQ